MSQKDEQATKQVARICLFRWCQALRFERRSSSEKVEHLPAPKTTPKRLDESLQDAPLDSCYLIQDVAQSTVSSEETILYLAYGSNLCRKTFRERRHIRPVSQINVVVPQLAMTFDLPGLPYKEPCFSNTRYRQAPAPEDSAGNAEKDRYHKQMWHKGLVGVVYEVTLADYAHIIATEGGGASYKDVLVDCYALPDDPSLPVPAIPSGTAFKAHTLFAPPPASGGARLARPDPDYAQPSPRYMKLITDGATELVLPYEYQEYLHLIRGYQMTSTKQRLGQFIFLSIWAPVLIFIFGAGRMFADKKGRYPPWLTRLAGSIFIGVWASYDSFFKDFFGDGERTIGLGSSLNSLDEKQPLLFNLAERQHEIVPEQRLEPTEIMV
ncbi:hypothetical protein GJ744_006589 [Endocarpon pusillum]|uniref:gamma-glutamylcyclotransferase n=1 Tax=Endocarpon pusillum TaxID=364733 RepID=A0A8H7AR64_9EURO|nr:hypothetical protein GJ744_006589 [Endocarpon pusillum]